jgi:putative heme-binding domain-containing protein
MSLHRTFGGQLSRLGSIALLATAASCGGAPAPEPAPAPVTAPVSERPLKVEHPAPFTPTVVQLTPDSAAALARIDRAAITPRLAPGLDLKLWAGEPMIADPIGITFDDQGRLYATRTRRTGEGEIDIRGHQDWMVPSITFKDVEDKRTFYHNVLAPERSAQNTWLKDWNGDGSRDWRDLAFAKEGLYRIEDTNGDGMADKSTLILEDFNDLVSDTFHDILWYKGDLFGTVSPDLWRLRDTNGDGVIDTKESLSHGSGVHIGFGGHGHSSPLIGPDGRIYWKQGDLGVHITNREGRVLDNPNSGVILRANIDGTNEEIFASGLRNPQNFAFDEYGNIISPDNDGDHPTELERLVYIVDGMDSGWRINWQFGKYVDPDNNNYKVWMDEGMWKTRWKDQAAYFTPPFANWHSGPAGLAYNPGTALGDAWKGYYFNAVFVGSPAVSTIQGFTVAPQGAGFKLDKDTAVVRGGILTTGVRFGPDGKLYLADWIEGWDPKGKGRIWTLDVPEAAANPARAEVKSLIAADFKSRSVADLVGLLGHADMRIREKAQFELVDRNAFADLLGVARKNSNQLARIHGMWGLHQLALKDPRRASALVEFLKDGDAEIRAQAAKLLGDVNYAPAATQYVALLKDTSPRVRFFAAQALGRIQYRPAIQPIVDMLAANNDEDVYLRHAGALALARIGAADQIAALSTHPNRAVRIAAVVALRRMKDPSVARFLADQDDYIVTEAARAINDDGGIDGALPALAAALEGKVNNEAFVRRAINANLRVGTPEAAKRVAAYASRSDATDELRVEAVQTLGVWPKPSILDRVDGYSHGPVQRDTGKAVGVAARDTAAARAALAPIVTPLLGGNASTALQVAIADAVGRLRVADAASLMYDKVRSGSAPEIRIAALRALGLIGDSRTAEAVRTALADQDATVRMAALSGISPLNLPEATATQLLSSVIVKGTVAEQQNALTALGKVQGTSGRQELTRLVDQLAQGKIAPDIQLEVAEAARATKSPELIAKLDALEKSRTGKPAAIAYADLLHGGDARRGSRVVFQGASSQCTRCHNFGIGTGANVGPPLRGVASRLTRDQLLEALVDPSARIAPGYGPVQVTLKNGQKYFGTLKEETDSYIVVDVSPAPKKIAKSDIAQRTNGPSPMPPMPTLLTRREIRDVVEYLSTLR